MTMTGKYHKAYEIHVIYNKIDHFEIKFMIPLFSQLLQMSEEKNPTQLTHARLCHQTHKVSVFPHQ